MWRCEPALRTQLQVGQRRSRRIAGGRGGGVRAGPLEDLFIPCVIVHVSQSRVVFHCWIIVCVGASCMVVALSNERAMDRHTRRTNPGCDHNGKNKKQKINCWSVPSPVTPCHYAPHAHSTAQLSHSCLPPVFPLQGKKTAVQGRQCIMNTLSSHHGHTMPLYCTCALHITKLSHSCLPPVFPLQVRKTAVQGGHSSCNMNRCILNALFTHS